MLSFRFLQVIVFIASFLLFQIEFIASKILLPNYGGSYFVWGASVVFFQTLLFLGYLYAHFVIKYIGIKTYRKIHCLVFLTPFVVFPGQYLPDKYPPHQIPLVLDVFLILLIIIGPVFFLLSTVSIVYQSWLAHSKLTQKNNPYALFAASNLGSFAALFTYPFVFEINFDLIEQQNIWRAGYLLLLLIQLAALKYLPVNPPVENKEGGDARVEKSRMVQWILFGAAGVMMFLSVTNIMSSQIAPMPLLWMLPLAAYLLSFVLNFKQKPWCPRWMVSKFHYIIGYALVYYCFRNIITFPTLVDIAILLGICFIFCMFSQQKLIALKPENSNHLTHFYVYISLGSLIGGVFVSWIIPLITNSFTEFIWAFFVVVVAWQLISRTKGFKLREVLGACGVVFILFFWPSLFPRYSLLSLLCIILAMTVSIFLLSKNLKMIVLSLAIILLISGTLENKWNQLNYVYKDRNYYGRVSIVDEEFARILIHGNTVHGVQLRKKGRTPIPLGYYSAVSPVGELLISDLNNFESIASIGLGTGTLNTYFRENQEIDVFELDPDAFKIASKYFSFIHNSAGSYRYIIGDARINIEQELKDKYDLIIVDAFNSDAIPVHLLTKEAMDIYHARIKAKGMTLFHVSNRFIDIYYPILKTAMESGANVCFKEGKGDKVYIYSSTWIAITWDKEQFAKLTDQLNWLTVNPNTLNHIRPWTDHYSTITPYVKYKHLL